MVAWELKASVASLAMLVALGVTYLPVHDEPTHWDAMLLGFCLTMLLSVVSAAVSSTMWQALFPEGWAWMLKNKPCNVPLLMKNGTEILPAIYTPILIWNDVYAMTLEGLENPAQSLSLQAPRSIWTAVGVVVAYMAHDCILMFWYREDMQKALGKGMYLQIWGHHLLSIMFWPIALPVRGGSVLIGWFLMSEGSNVLLTTRAVLIKFNHGNHKWMTPISAGWLLSFIVFRIIPLPILAYFLVMAQPWHMPIGVRTLCYVTWPLPLFLNVYWLSLAINMATKLLVKKPARVETKVSID